jgi:hypothetical protein
MGKSYDIGTKVGDWTLGQVQESVDDWWLRSLGHGDPSNSFATRQDAALYAKEGEHPQFRRKSKPVWIWTHGPTGSVHTAEIAREQPTDSQLERGEPGKPILDEHNRTIPFDPPAYIEPKSGAQVTVTPPGERERIQTQIDKLQAQIDKLQGA